jgi:hypothetical protein
MTTKLIPEEIKEFLNYDPIIGHLQWIKPPHEDFGKSLLNQTITCTDKKGYIIIGFAGKHYKGHRVAWFLHTGKQPSLRLDHINGIKSHNAFLNLREASPAQNSANRPKSVNNTSGYKGVFAIRYKGRLTGKYFASLSVNRIRHYLGSFDSPEEASIAYIEAAKSLHKEFFCP